MNEAAWIVESGDATIETVDSTTKFDMGLPMGSFELADQVGIDVGYHVLEYMHEVLGEAYRPCPLLVEKVEAEELGKKTGSGFYDYENGGAEIPTDAIDADVRKRLLAVMANEVAGLAGNDVADAPAIDRAVMLGAGFPDGPAKLADSEGSPNSSTSSTTFTRRRARSATRRPTSSARPPRRGASTGDESADTDGETDGDALAAYDTLNVAVEDRIGHVEIDRPHRMNTISGELLDELSDAIDRLDADDDVRAILLSEPATARSPRAPTTCRAWRPAAQTRSPRSNSRGRASRRSASSRRVGQAGRRRHRRLLSRRRDGARDRDGSPGRLRALGARPAGAQPRAAPGVGRHPAARPHRRRGAREEIIFTADRYEAETLADYGFINEVVPDDDELDERARELVESPPPARRSHRSTRNARCTPVAPTARPASKWRRWASAT